MGDNKLDADIEALLANPADGLERWYESLSPSEDNELVLAGGPRPSLERLGRLFDGWWSDRADDFRHLLCTELQYATLSARQKELGEIVVVAAVAAALQKVAADFDPVATAVLLVTRRSIDRLCASHSGGSGADDPS